MFKSSSTSLILLGVLAIIVGILALAWPGATILALVILFAVYAFIDAGLQATRAFSSDSAGPVIGHLLLGLIDIAAGIVALVWPGPTALVLVIIVGAWALSGASSRSSPDSRAARPPGPARCSSSAGWCRSRSASCSSPAPASALSPSVLFGLFALIYGISQITLGIQLRHTGQTLHSILKDAA